MLLNFHKNVLEDTSFQKDVLEINSFEIELAMIVNFSPLTLSCFSFPGLLELSDLWKQMSPYNNIFVVIDALLTFEIYGLVISGY